MTLNEQNGLIKNTRTLILSYTGLFIILICGIFSMFMLENKVLVNLSDAYDQGYFWTIELKRNIASLLAGDGFPAWSWSKGLGLDVKAVTDPFMLIASMFPIEHIELGYSVATVLRLYFSGLAFIAFTREIELDRYQSLMGALCYTFSTWIIDVSLIQSQFINIVILFPLLILSVDRIYKGKSPVIFMLVVAYVMCNNVYLAYMAGISTVMYIILRYFAYCEKFSIKEYAIYVGKFIIYGLIGIAASAAITMTTINSLMGASTGSNSVTYDMIRSQSFIMDLGNTFLSRGYIFEYSAIGIPIFGLLVVAVAYRYFSLRRTNLIMTAIFAIMMLFPFFSSMFNGFGYVTTRWYFMLIFFVAWSAAEAMDLDRLAEVKNLIIMAVWMCLIVGSTMGFAFLDLTANYNTRQFIFVAGNLLAGALIYIIILTGIRNKTSLKLRQAGVLIVAVGVLVCAWSISFYHNTGKYVADSEIHNQLEVSTQRAGALIEDDGFYRIDQVEGINVHKSACQPANENLYWGTKTIYLYDSKVPARLSEFNKLLGNNYGYSKRVYVQSNGNRMGLDFLEGVKYFLGDDTANGITGSDQYAGYGFEKYKTLDGVNVFKNKYDSGLGFGYDKVISESEFGKLSRLEREQGILQAMVLPDETIAELDQSQVVTAKDIQTDIDDVNFVVVSERGAHLDGNKIIVDAVDEDAPRAGFTINVAPVHNSQLVLSFDNLIRYNDAGKQVDNFILECTSSKLKCSANNTKNNQTIAGIVDYDMNLGYYDSYNGNIRVTFTEPGVYEFDKMYVSAMDVDNYDKFASQRMSNKYKIDEYDNSHVSGTVDMTKDGYVFFSIPASKKWDIYVDGNKAEKITKANITFVAVAVDKGEHNIVLQHQGQFQSIAVIASLIGLLMIAAIGIVGVRRRREQGGV